MFRTLPPARLAVMALVVTGAVLVSVSCSSDDGASAPTTTAASAPGSAPGSTMATLSDEERLAEAKTVAVGFFEAQAVNSYDQALDRSSGAAARTVAWARAVNGIAAANDSGYQVASVEAPNVRVQIDALTADGTDRWAAEGFVELSFRPGPVVSTTSTTSPADAPTTQASPDAPSTFVVDLVFTGSGDQLRLDDYRLDDVPYPVSQLFTSFEVPEATVAGVEGTVVLGHRDLDGSVQYVVDLTNDGSAEAAGGPSTFTPAAAGTAPGTATIPVGPDTVEGTTFADPLAPGAAGQALIVFPGAFPGAAGTLTLEVDGATAGDAAEATPLSWALPDYPALTPRPVGTVTASTTTSSSSSTTVTSSTTTSVPSSTTTPTSAPTTSAPTTSTSSTSTTSSSTTTTTEP